MMYRFTGKGIEVDLDKKYISLMKAKADAYRIVEKEGSEKTGVIIETPIRRGVWKPIGYVHKNKKGEVVWTYRDGVWEAGASKMLPDGTVVESGINHITNNELTVPYYIAKQDYENQSSRYWRCKEEKDKICEKNPKGIKCKAAKGRCAKQYVKMKKSEKRFEKAKKG